MQPIQLPNELQALVGIVVLFLVVNGLKGLSELLGRDLTGWGTIIAGIIAATVIFFINQILAVVPAAQQPIVEAFLNFLVLLLGAVGLKRFELKTLRKQ